MPYGWVMDVATGIQKNHTLSAKILEAAIADTQLFQFLIPDKDFGKGQGDTYNFTNVAAITEPTDSELDVEDDLPEDSYSVTTVAVTVKSHGKSVKFTSLAKDLAHYDLENSIQSGLKNQMQLSLDTLAAKAFKGTLVKYAPTGASSNNIATSGTFGATASSNLNVYHVEQIRDYLYDTLLCPPYKDGDYIGVVRDLALRGIKNDSNWRDWHQYTDPKAKWSNEVGRIERVRFVGTNHAKAFGKKGTGSVLGEGVFFGDQACGLVETSPPHLIIGHSGKWGFDKAVGWYGVLAAYIKFPTANPGECRIVHLGSL